MDILGALEATPARGVGRCALARFLDAIPEDEAGRDELVRLVETVHEQNKARNDTLSAQKMAKVLSQLGFKTTENPVHYHRNQTCACYR